MSRTTLPPPPPGTVSPSPRKRGGRLRAGRLVPLLAGGVLAFAATARANTIHVTTTADEYDTIGSGTGCSLREAITAANTDAAFGGCSKGKDIDTILLPSGEYKLTRSGSDDTNVNGDLDVTGGVWIVGDGAKTTIIDAQGLDRVLHVLPKAIAVNLFGVTLRGGSSSGAGGAVLADGFFYTANVEIRDSSAAVYGGGVATAVGAAVQINYTTIANCHSGLGGGGIFNLGDATVSDSTVAHNYTTAAKTYGGGILNLNQLEIDRATLSANTAEGHGGGLANLGNGAVALLADATISGNGAKGNGGGVLNTNGGVVKLHSSTVASNHADSNNSGSGDGGGIFTDSGTVTVNDTILGDNTRKTGAQASPDDCKGTLDSLGYNLLETMSGCTLDNVSDGNKLGQDPGLQPLADNGGPVRTHRLKPDSPAIETGDPHDCKDPLGHLIFLDARSSARFEDYDGVGGARCDIGAYEAIPDDVLCFAKPATPPTLFLPANQSSAEFERTDLQWEGVWCATQYKVIVRVGAVNGPRFARAHTQDVPRFHIPRPLTIGKTYYWRVKACNALGCRKSAWWSFVAAEPP